MCTNGLVVILNGPYFRDTIGNIYGKNVMHRGYEWSPCKYAHVPECDLIWKKGFFRSNDDKFLQVSSCIIQVGPKFQDKCPYKIHREETAM